VFVIDPEGIGALQTTDKHKVATPANRRPGNKVLVPPPNTQEMAEERVLQKEIYECKDWYFCKKALNLPAGRRPPLTVDSGVPSTGSQSVVETLQCNVSTREIQTRTRAFVAQRVVDLNIYIAHSFATSLHRSCFSMNISVTFHGLFSYTHLPVL